MNKIYKMERLKRKMKQVERQRSYAWAMFYRAREEEHDSMVRLIQMYKEKTRSSKLSNNRANREYIYKFKIFFKC